MGFRAIILKLRPNFRRYYNTNSTPSPNSKHLPYPPTIRVRLGHLKWRWPSLKVLCGTLSSLRGGWPKNITPPPSKLHYQECSRSFIAHTMFVVEKEYKIFIDTTNKEFPMKQTPIKLVWKTKHHITCRSPKIRKRTSQNALINCTCIALPSSPKSNRQPHNISYALANVEK